jgi:hypothetical protein
MKKLCAVITAVLMGLALTTPIADAAPKRLTMILISGHGDTQAFNLEQQMQAQGWIPRNVNVVKITYLADAFQGELSTAQGADEIVKAYTAAHCGGAAPCELHGASLGANPAIRASRRLGQQDPPKAFTKVVLHIAPNPATGAWHSLNNDTLIDAFDQFSAGVPIKEIPTKGMEHWYHQDDYAANKAPQCFNDQAILYQGWAFRFGGAHLIQPKNGVHDVWTGPDGVINHEFGAAASPLTVSGNSPRPNLTCPEPPGVWYQGIPTPIQ